MNWFMIRAVVKTALAGACAVWLVLNAVRRDSGLKWYDRIIQFLGGILMAGLFVELVLIISGKLH